MEIAVREEIRNIVLEELRLFHETGFLSLSPTKGTWKAKDAILLKKAHELLVSNKGFKGCPFLNCTLLEFLDLFISKNPKPIWWYGTLAELTCFFDLLFEQEIILLSEIGPARFLHNYFVNHRGQPYTLSVVESTLSQGKVGKVSEKVLKKMHDCITEEIEYRT